MAYINIPSAVADDKIGVVEGTYCAVIGRNVAVIVRPWRTSVSRSWKIHILQQYSKCHKLGRHSLLLLKARRWRFRFLSHLNIKMNKIIKSSFLKGIITLSITKYVTFI